MTSAPAASPRTLVIACGALARELLAVTKANGWAHLHVTCLPAILHNRPQEIPERVRAKIRGARGRYARILCLYGDCGTGGALDAMLVEEGVERIEGAHCYGFFAGNDAFDAMMEDEPGTFFLTDYLARHFERLVWRGLGLDRHPDLFDDYFRHYRRLVYLAQMPDETTLAAAHAAAARLKLPLQIRNTGLTGLERFLRPRAA